MHATDPAQATLLDRTADPAPVERVVATARPGLLFVCEHAGRHIPRALNGLGVEPGEMDRHIAYAIGAEAVARRLAEALGAGLILQRYSRLVIDCNRPPKSRQSIPEVSDGTRVPANADLSAEARAMRIAEIFDPFAEACRQALADPRIRATYSIHSFTPELGGVARPWHIGFCARRRDSGASALAGLFRAAHPDLKVGENEPYRIDDDTDWFIPQVAEPRGVPHALIEIRNDQIADAAGQALWAGRLCALFQTIPETAP
jgi:predicted N-formylglutamate amidohydrolase